MSRLSIDISSEQHRKIKAMAVLQGKSIKDLVLDRVLPVGNKENEVWDQLMAILDERIEEADKGGITNKTIDEIAQGVLKEKGNNV